MDNTETTLSNLMKRNSLRRSPSNTSARPEANQKMRNEINEDERGRGNDKKNWETEKEVFELQLTQLQEQLVAAMVKNQQLGKCSS